MPAFSPLRAADHPGDYRCLDLEVGPDLAFRIDGLPPRFFDVLARFLSYFVTSEPLRDPILIQAYRRPPDWEPSVTLLFEHELFRLWKTADDGANEAGLPDDLAGHLPGNPRLLIESRGLTGWCETEHTRAGLLIDEASPDGTEEYAAQAVVPLLFELALDRGWLGIHAAAVAIDGKGLLLPAASGSGKSTLYAQAADAGFDLLSDDLVWLRPTDEGWWMQPFPRGLPWVEAPDPTIEGAPLRAIVAPSISKAVAHEIRPCSTTDLVKLLLPEAGLIPSSARAGQGFRRAVALAGSVPTFRLEVGWHKPAAEAMREILNSVG